ncbi:MAG: biotin--[acetyl-CoA-carboxylase] ligase [Gemmatimonadetes bacterium]|nr:biotin--[acetyl-CoA-carboxylase] ligase [Gemmatimonadota bacterium]
MAERVDGLGAAEVAARCGVPRAVLLATVTSTLDVAHTLASEGAETGTLVVARHQTAGRGQHGRSWRSEPDAGVWLTLIERADEAALSVLALRIGLALAPALDELAGARVQLKWPNDLLVADRKLAGVLVEARWRDGQPEWVSIGVGINLRQPHAEEEAAGLRSGVRRVDVLAAVVPALRVAAAQGGTLAAGELSAWSARDFAAGRRIDEPTAGVVLGIDAGGALLVESLGGVTRWRTGSIKFAPPRQK